MSSYALTDPKLRADAFARAEKRLAEFHVETIVDNEHVRLFRCWDGKSGDCAFRVAEYANVLVITGDIGEWVFVRCERMLNWARGACMSDDYFAEKLQAWRDGQLMEFWPEAVRNYIDDSLAECDDNETAQKWRDLRDEYRWHEDQGDDGREFHRALYASGLCDGAELPTVHRYAFRFHWIQRAVAWLCEQLSRQQTPPTETTDDIQAAQAANSGTATKAGQ